MADTRRRSTWGGRFRLLARFVGLTGAAAAAVGAVLLSTAGGWPDSWPAAEDRGRAAVAAVSDDAADPFVRGASIALVGGLAAVAVALVVELLGALLLVTTRRAAGGLTATVGTAAAVVLLVVVNLYSVDHPRRYDLTRDGRFTLPQDVAADLRRLRPDSPTTVVVYQQHKTAGSLSGKPDSYDYAAERKVVEKVTDLVDRFRELGGRFRVVVLDVEDEGYERQLADLTKDAPELKAAIDAAPDNSVFFSANGRVQRLAFDDLLPLDKTASKAADGGRGNLVLLPQGVERFARRVLAVQERRPRAAVCVVHGFLGTDGVEPYSLKGARKALTDRGFEVVDIVLRKNWNNDKELEPAAHTKAENRLEEAEGELEEAAAVVRASRADAATVDEVKGVLARLGERPAETRSRVYGLLFEDAKNRGWLEVTAVYTRWTPKTRGGLTAAAEAELRADLLAGLDAQKARLAERTAELEKERRAADDRLKEALKDERSVQDRRVSDVKAKFARLLADVDLLIVPRFTVGGVTTGRGVDPQLHAFSPEQLAVVRDFMAAGKPVLALLGPTTPTGSGRDRPPAADGFEELLAERGVELGKDTVVFDSEGKALAGHGAGGLFGGSGPPEVPPLAVEDRSGGATVAPNPVGEAVRLTGRGVEQKLDVRARALRPVYLAAGRQAALPFAGEFVLTDREAWNESKPFPLGDAAGRVTYVPRFEPARADDPAKGTRAEERRGPFPVAVAVEGGWAGPGEAVSAAVPNGGGLLFAGLSAAAVKVSPPPGRLVVVGSGGLFAGDDLKPAQEKLLLHTANWLVNRPDRLPTEPAAAWSFPRVSLTDREATLWRWGTAAGLPLAAVYLGLVGVLARRR